MGVNGREKKEMNMDTLILFFLFAVLITTSMLGGYYIGLGKYEENCKKEKGGNNEKTFN